MWNPKISIIMPVYNVEKYLRECLDSLINQTLKDIEIICVDDGSTDSSLDILKEYAQKDNRITVMKQENSGPGVARNKCISLAKGKYTTFVDSDDFLMPNALEKLYKTAEENSAQVVQCNHQIYHETTNHYKPYDFSQNIKNIYNYDLKKIDHYSALSFPTGRLSNLGGVAWGRLYLTSYLQENEIKFSETKLGEDHLFISASNLLAEKIFFISDYLYCYRKGIVSLTTKVNDEVFSMFLNVSNMEHFLKTHNLYSKLLDDFEQYKFEAFKSIIQQVPKTKKKLFFSKLKEILTKQNFSKLWWISKSNFFLNIKYTKKGKLIIKIFKIPVFVKKNK